MKNNMHYKAHKKIRQIWSINPKERVADSKKEYDRQSLKQETRDIIDEELDTDDFDWNYNDPIDSNQ